VSELPVVVCDAGPLIHLDELGCLGLLADFAEILVPDRVWEEVAVHRPSALSHTSLRLVRTSEPRQISAELDALSRLLGLHCGEQQALQLSVLRAGSILLTEDTAARLAARNLGLSVHGTIGILIRAVRRQQRSKLEVLSILRSLPTNCTLHIRATLLDEFIRQVEQSA